MPLSKISGNSFNASANTNIDNGLLFLNPTTNRVGVGITTPTAPFHAYTNAELNNTIAVFQNDISTPGYLGEVILSAPNRPAVRTNYRTSNDTNGFLNYDTGEFKLFANAGGSASEVLRANRYGIGLGSNSPSSGMGIMFPASQSASSDANTLDDYEEGTWSPAIGGNATYYAQEGYYTKIGNIVYFYGKIIINSKGTGNNFTMTGFPFNANYNIRLNVQYWTLLATNVVFLGAIGSGNTQVDFYSTTAAASNVATNTVFGNGTTISFTGFYSV